MMLELTRNEAFTKLLVISVFLICVKRGCSDLFNRGGKLCTNSSAGIIGLACR